MNMGMIPGLTEGRIGHYVACNNRHLAAIVIGYSDDGRADLAVFTNMQNVNGEKNFGLQFHQNIPYDLDMVNQDAEPLAGTWHWPERT
jgi:hypothetical protein